jgi:hypothetical protein
MDKSLTIATSQVPFIVYLVVAGMVGVLIENTQYIYIYALLLLSLFGCLEGWKRSIEFLGGTDAVFSRTTLFGIVVRKHRVPLSEFKIIRNRIQFNGARISGNTCVTELVDVMGRVFKVREESIGFPNNESSEARWYVERIAELTLIPKGEPLIENPLQKIQVARKRAGTFTVMQFRPLNQTLTHVRSPV